MKNIKSPMATPTYRRRRAKREFWNDTRAFASNDLKNPSAKSAQKATKHLATKKKKSTSARDWISQMGEDIQYSVGYKKQEVRYV